MASPDLLSLSHTHTNKHYLGKNSVVTHVHECVCKDKRCFTLFQTVTVCLHEQHKTKLRTCSGVSPSPLTIAARFSHHLFPLLSLTSLLVCGPLGVLALFCFSSKRLLFVYFLVVYEAFSVCVSPTRLLIPATYFSYHLPYAQSNNVLSVAAFQVVDPGLIPRQCRISMSATLDESVC